MSETVINEAAVLSALSDFRDPETGRSITQQKQLTVHQADNEKVQLGLALTTHSKPLWKLTRADLIERLQSHFPGLTNIEVELSEHQRRPQPLGQIGLRCKSVIAVGSGKGGVGKSTIAAALAFGLQRAGCKVGLMDADVYGPSVPTLLGVNQRPEVMEQETQDGQKVKRIVPIESQGLKVISIGFMIEPGQAVIWRGPMLHGAITQFLRDTEWGDLDYLFIDMPPGTGDIALTLSQLLPLTGSVVVCTPQDVALVDAERAIAMFRQVKIPVLGMVENMSYFLCPDNGKRYDIFGSGGAQSKAKELNVPFLGEVPINISIRIRGDEGQIAGVFDEEDSKEYLEHLCFQLTKNIADKARQQPALPSFTVLK